MFGSDAGYRDRLKRPLLELSYTAIGCCPAAGLRAC